jgi:hypothetical protein
MRKRERKRGQPSHRAHSNEWRIVDRDKSISPTYLPRISTASSAMLLIPGGGAASLKHRINHLHDSANVHVTKNMMRTKHKSCMDPDADADTDVRTQQETTESSGAQQTGRPTESKAK